MAFTAQDVKDLREKTGCGMMDCKKALTEIIERDEQSHAADHGNVFLHRHLKARHERPYKRLCDAIGYQIADADIHSEAHNDLPIPLFILKGEILVEKIAQYTAEKVV